MFESSDRLNERIDHYLAARDLDDLFQRVLQRLEDEHGDAIVRDVMTLVWASRRGLSDAELGGITGADREALTALIGALEYHLMRREGLLAFFHDHLRQAVANRYLAQEGSAVDDLHMKIARYFAGQPVESRRAEEEPWQLQQGHAWEALKDALSSIEMFRTLCGESTTYQLMGYWLAIGDRYDMVDAYRESLASYEATHDNADLPALLDDLGRFYSECGRYEEGELLCRRSLEMRGQTSDANTLETVTALDNLSTLLYHTGRSEEAIALSRHALEIREGALGEEHPEIASNLSSLGAFLYAAREYEEAERLLQRALSLAERITGVSVQVVATILNNLGAILSATRRYDAALPYFERARQINERIYGAEHPEIASNLVNIAVILETQGDLEASEKIYRQALEISEKVLGPDHPHLAVTLTNLGGVVREMGDLEGAEVIFRRALGIRERVLGSDNIETVATMLRLGYVLRRKKDFVGAHRLYSEALALRERICGPDDPYLERIRKGLAEVEELMREATEVKGKKKMRPADVRRAGRK
jgi:tetratricopeptide (TPR) repeat protein